MIVTGECVVHFAYFSFHGRYTSREKLQWKISQPGDVFSENQVKMQIPLGLLQSSVL